MTRASKLLRRILASTGILVMLLMLAPIGLAQGPNLLQNPGFERPYVALPAKENCRIAAPWVAWYIEGSKEETSQGYRLAPEYKAAFSSDWRSASRALRLRAASWSGLIASRSAASLCRCR